MSPSPVAPPKIDIPTAKSTVEVSIIDTTSRITGINAHKFLTPQIPQVPFISGPAYSFFIKHAPTNKAILFDLGVRKDWENYPPAVVDRLKSGTMEVTVEKNASEILVENGIKLETIDNIIWSHRHFDHQGDPSLFPKSTNLTVGPGFVKKIGPGYPEKSDSEANSSAWQGRRLVEVDFANDVRKTKVGRYRAIDYFEDGSFYLLQTSGHTVDHMCGFARTKLGGDGEEDEFILMGGDIAHHGGEFKPTKYGPIPDRVEPDPRRKPWSGGYCPGELFARSNIAHEGDEKWTKPFFQPHPDFPDNLEEAEASLSELEEFDSHDNIFPICAHDGSLLGVLDTFPKTANDWREKGWKKEAHFRFLADLNSEELGLK